MYWKLKFGFLVIGVTVWTVINAQEDSTIITTEECTVGFFSRAKKITALNNNFVVNKAGKTMSLANFFKQDQMDPFAENGLYDLDNDGKEELVISNFTGGAHCCDQLYIFKNIGPGKYQYMVNFLPGMPVLTR
jgi:hypothetical protein